jgi:hypothetical protein
VHQAVKHTGVRTRQVPHVPAALAVAERVRAAKLAAGPRRALIALTHARQATAAGKKAPARALLPASARLAAADAGLAAMRPRVALSAHAPLVRAGAKRALGATCAASPADDAVALVALVVLVADGLMCVCMHVGM